MRYNSKKKPKDLRRSYMPKGFECAYYKCTPDQMQAVRHYLMTRCGWSRQRFYNRMRGLFSYTPGEIKIVSEVFGSLGLDAWTGSRITDN